MFTPSEVNKNVERLLKTVNASHEPVFLDIEPELDSAIQDCFPIVQRKIEVDGGRMILGWQIWETPNLIEAEFHAVWETPDGDLKDITPKLSDDYQILFVEDENMTYNGKQVNNIRLNITNNRLVDDLIDVCNTLFVFENKGERALLYDLTQVLSPDEIQNWQYLQALKAIIDMMIDRNETRDSQCFCSMGKKFKNCHGNQLRTQLAKLI